ncbi:Ac92-like protein [Callinectes sapidus nudivirus]|nr:Ac92-like protein [Callinectes sapidus nudivirus]
MLKYDTIKVKTYNYYGFNDKELIREYKRSISKTFAYIKQLVPKKELKQCGQNLLEYQYHWMLLVEDILKTFKQELRHESYREVINPNITYENLMKYFNIEATALEQHEYFKNIWGPIYWNFLHLTSMLCRTEYQKNLFAANMFNFNLCMICSECAFNFKQKKPFLLMMIISITGDSITPIYTLHNMVNDAIRHKHFEFEDFLKKYKLYTSPEKEFSYTLVTNHES